MRWPFLIYLDRYVGERLKRLVSLLLPNNNTQLALGLQQKRDFIRYWRASQGKRYVDKSADADALNLTRKKA